MEIDNQLDIPFSKTKIIVSFLSSLVFIGLGLWFLILPPKNDHALLGNPIFIYALGSSAILFFGYIALLLLRKLADKKPGLSLNKLGIVDHSSAVAMGTILWEDIEMIKIAQTFNQKFLICIVKNPEVYLNKTSKSLWRKTLKMNHKTYGSPITISSNALQIKFNDLFELLILKKKEYDARQAK